MAANKYYLIARKEKHKYRKRLITAMKKKGYSEEDALRIVDAVAGRTPSGKEAAAAAILKLLADGSDKTEIDSFLESFVKNKYAYTVK